MPRRPLHVRLAWLAVAAVAATSCSESGDEKGPPNILLISIDTLRPDRLGCYGHDRDTSPTLDKVAESGVLFEDVTSASPWTLPSHASLLTGRYPSRHGVTDHITRLPRGVATLASVLRGQGYMTKAVVNSHNLSERYGLNRGFLEFQYVPEQEEDGSITNKGPLVLEQAKAWLEEGDEGPFFLFLHFYDVHTDFTPGESYRKRFVRPYDGPVDGTTPQLADFRTNKTQLDENDLRFLFDMYDAEIRELDDLLGEFLDWLDERGLSENTVLAITSDHGEEFQEHGSLLHGRTYYQEVIRIPLILRGPGVPVGMRIPTPVHLVDVAPTLLTLVSSRLPVRLDGIDLSAAWREGATLPERPLFSEADHNNLQLYARRMVRTPRHKLLYNKVTKETQLYDLELDPLETSDISERDAGTTESLLESLKFFLGGQQERETIDPPSPEELEKLKNLGYGGDEEDPPENNPENEPEKQKDEQAAE